MHKQEWWNDARSSTTSRHVLGDSTMAWPWDLLAGFSERECQHLIFLRWLYCQGRLTEW